MTNYKIRLIEIQDNRQVEELIRTVMPEFGADGPGFAINDPEVSHMFENYHLDRHVYLVVTDGQRILGGGGIAPLKGAPGDVCELRKMYFKQEIRGKGLGSQLMEACLDHARKMGFKSCYLETLEAMSDAKKLYLKSGFTPLKAPLGETGHFSCDSFFIKDL